MHSKSSPAPDNPAGDAANGAGSSPPRRQPPESPRSRPDNSASEVISSSLPHSPDGLGGDSSPTIVLPSYDRNPTLVTVKTAAPPVDKDDELSDPPEFDMSADDTEDDDPISVDDNAAPTKPQLAKTPGVVRPMSHDTEGDAEDDDAYEDVDALMEQDSTDGEDEQIQIIRETPAPAPAPVVPQGPMLPPFLGPPNETDSQFKTRMGNVRRKFSSRNFSDEEKYRMTYAVHTTLVYLLSHDLAFSHSRSQFFVLRIVPEVAERLMRERACHSQPFTNLIDEIVNRTLFLFTLVPDPLMHDSGSLIRAVHQLLEEDPLGMDDSEDDEMNDIDDVSYRWELIHHFTFTYQGVLHVSRYANNPGLPFHLLRLLFEIASSCQSIITPARPPYSSEEMRVQAHRDQDMADTINQLMIDLSQAAMARVKLLGRSDEDIKAVDRRQFSDLIEVVDVMNRFAAMQLRQTIASVCLACTVLDKRLFGLSVVKDLIHSVSTPSPEMIRQVTTAHTAPPQVAPAAAQPDITTPVTPAVPNASPMIGPQLPGQVPPAAAAAIAAQASQSAQNAIASFMANYRPEFGSPQDREAADLAHWLISEDIIDRLFVRNVHLELVQRSGDVVCFLLRRSVITDEDMSPVWQLLRPMHHATLRTAAARVLGECAAEMAIDTLQASVVRVREMDAGDIDEPVVSMVQQMVRAVLEYRKVSVTDGQTQYHQYLQRVEQYLQCRSVVSRSAAASTSPTGSQQQQQQIQQHQHPRQRAFDDYLILVQQTASESLDLVWNLVRDSSHLPTYKRSDLAWWMDGTIRYSPTLSSEDLTPLMVSALSDLQMHQSVVPACIVLRALVVNGTLDDEETRAMIRAKVVDDFVAISKNPQWDPTFAIDEEFKARANLLHVLVSSPVGSGGAASSVPLTRDEGITLWNALAPSPLLQQTFFGYLRWIIEETETEMPPETRVQNRSTVARLVIDGVRDRLAAATPAGTAADGSELVSEPLMHLVREAIVYVAVEDGEMTPDKTVVKPVANEDLVWQILAGGAAAACLSVPGSPISPIASSNSISNVDQTVVQSAAQFIVALSLQGSHEYLASSVEPFVTRVITRLGRTTDVRAFRSILHVLQMYMAQFQARFPKAAGAVGGQDAGLSLPHKSMLGAVKPLVLTIRPNGSNVKAATTATNGSLELELPGLSTVAMLRSRLAELFNVTDDPDRIRPFARGKELTAGGPASQLLSELGIETRDTIQVMIRPLKADDKTPSPPAEANPEKANSAESPDSEKLKALQVSSNVGDDAGDAEQLDEATATAATDVTRPEPVSVSVESPDPEMLEALQVSYSIDANAMDEGTPARSAPPLSPSAPPSIPSPQVLLTRPELFSHIMDLLSFGDRRALLVYGFLQELPTLPSLAHQLTPAGGMPAADLLNPRLPYRYLYTLEVLQIAALQNCYDSGWRASMRERGILRTVANNLVDLDQSQKAGRRCLLASLVVLSTVAQELADDPLVQVQQIEEFMCRTITSGPHPEIVCECLRFLFLLVSLRPEASAGQDVCGVVQGVLTSAESQVRSFACEQLMVATSLPMDLVSHLWSLVDVDGMPSELYAILNHFLETPLAVSVRASPNTVNRLFESVRNNPTAPKLGLLASLIAPGCAPSDEEILDFGSTLYTNMYPADWNQDPPICNPDLREAAHRVIASMCRVSPKLTKVISEQLITFLAPLDAVMSSPFECDPKKTTRRTFVGLVNQGATCYQNSLLQHFFMDRAFRRGILECEPLPEVLAEANGGAGVANAKPASGGKEKKRKERGSTIRALQALFAELQESQRQYAETSTFIDTLRTAEGEEINPFVQMDVDEFYNQLFDRLESEMKGTPQVDMLDHRYGGRLVHMIESNECGHVSTREEPYHALQCEVKGRQTLEESLAHYVQGESLSGDNKYRCSTCNNLVDAVKSTHVGTLPTNLIFHLKRFEFDMEFFHRIKINDRFEFPPTIDMRPYLTPAGRAATPGSAADPGETKYDLTGVLVHMGTSESGHYYSFIRDAETLEWFQFNDTIVSPFQVDHLPEEAFGGGKANSAYMLVYRRRGTADDPAAEQAAAKAAIPKDTLEAIYETNAELRSNLCLFDRPLGELVLNLGQFDLTSWIVPVAVYYVRVALRGTDRTLLTQISSLIAESITQPLADWFLGYFVAIPRPWAAIAHNVIDATSPDIRANVVNTLSAVIRHRASDLAVRQFASVLSHTFVEVDLRLWWRTCDQICVLALAVLDRVPNAFEKNIAKLISTVTGDWDRQSKTNIMAISKANLRPINVLILRAVFNADSMDVPSLLFVSNDRHACLYFVQLAVYCHEWVDLLEPLTAIAKKFGVAGSMYIGLVGAIKYIQTPEAHQFLRQAFKAITSVSTPKDRELAIGWLKWVVESEAKELSEMAGITIVLVLYMLAGCEETLPVVRVTANVWMLLRASPSPLVKGYVTQFLQVIGVLAPNPPAPAGR